MYYAWGNCDFLNQFIERMNLLTNFPIFKNLFDKLLITLPNKEFTQIRKKFSVFYKKKKTDDRKLHMIIKNHNTKTSSSSV